MKAQGLIIGLELAKLARKAGFNEITDYAHCFDTVKKGYYISYDPDYFVNTELWDMHYAAPTIEQLHAWLRAKNIVVLIGLADKLSLKPSYYPQVYVCDRIWRDRISDQKVFSTYEAAFEDGLKIALESL